MAPPDIEPSCRACGSSRLRLGFDLGLLPLANSFLSVQNTKVQAPESRYPLRIFYCDNCRLIQLSDIVDRREMFDDYAFLTATADTSLIHFDKYADQLTHKLALSAEDLVVDIVYHEHLSYFGFKPLSQVFERYGLELVGIEHFPAIHGGTIRGLAAHLDAFPKQQDMLDQTFGAEEKGADFRALERFANHAKEFRR